MTKEHAGDPPPSSPSTDGATGTPEPFLVLNVPRCPPPEEEFLALERILESLEAPGPGVVWIRGRERTGRSTLVQRALERHAATHPELLGALRIECWPGLRLEESLHFIGDFLGQLGIPELAGVLGQRTSIAGKIRVFHDTLKRHRVCVWFDDFQNVAGSHPTSNQNLPRLLADGWRELKEIPGRILLVTSSSGPDGLTADATAARGIQLEPGDTVDMERLWERCRNDLETKCRLPRLEELQPCLRRDLLAQRLLARAASRGGTDPAEFSTLRHVGDVVAAIREKLDPSGCQALDLLAVHRRPVSQGGLRSLAGLLGLADLETRGLEELRDHGLLVTNGDRGDRLHVHPAICEARQQALKSGEPELWRDYHRGIAQHLLQAATRSRSLWTYYWSFVHLMRGGEFGQAYEVQKVFLEEFLSVGYLDLCKSVLESCAAEVSGPYRAVLVGNLAIIHKGEGNYGEAIRLYERSLKELTASGDVHNIARIHHQMGNTHYLAGEFDRAMEHYETCLEFANRVGDSGVILMARVQMANVQFSSGDLETALKNYRQSLELARSVGHDAVRTALHVQLAQIHLRSQRFPEAQDELRVAGELATHHGDRRNLLKIAQVGGVLGRRTRDYDGAVASLRQAALHARALGDPVEEANSQIHISVVEEERQSFGKALDALLGARDILETLRPAVTDEQKLAALEKNLATVGERLRDIAGKVGPEAFGQIISGLGRQEPFPQ